MDRETALAACEGLFDGSGMRGEAAVVADGEEADQAIRVERHVLCHVAIGHPHARESSLAAEHHRAVAALRACVVFLPAHGQVDLDVAPRAA